jgi:Ca2+-transporting ATPase
MRGGIQCQVPVHDIVVGDIVLLETGDKICADGIIVESDDLKCEESAMTGESKNIVKDVNNPFMLSGCQVVEGRGTMLVLCTGINSKWGQIKKLVDKEPEATPLQEHLEKLAEDIGRIGVIAATLTFVSG